MAGNQEVASMAEEEPGGAEGAGKREQAGGVEKRAAKRAAKRAGGAGKMAEGMAPVKTEEIHKEAEEGLLRSAG